MNQIECLTRSIEDKWIPIVEGEKSYSPRDRYTGCECCRLYFDAGCTGCPIYKDTHRLFCAGTPFEEFVSFLDIGAATNYDLMIEAKAAATAELEYLIDLRERLRK